MRKLINENLFPSEKVFNELKLLVDNGFFFHLGMQLWKGGMHFSHGNNRDLFFHDLPFCLDIKLLGIEMNKELFFHACKTYSNVYFVLKDKAKYIVERSRDINQRLELISKKILSNEDGYLDSIRDNYYKVAELKWRKKLKQSGEMPKTFFESCFSDYQKNFLNNRNLPRKLKIIITPINYKLTEEYNVFGDIKLFNDEYILRLYRGIIYKRHYLINVINKKIEKIKLQRVPNYKSLVNIISLYRSTLFYGDDTLLEKIEDLRMTVIKSPRRDKITIFNKSNEIIDYLSNDKRFNIEEKDDFLFF